mmetsp:Transcript_98492/g.254607  ORF Transcript_98492/g.254607 Transcript_98492/m.254607 type:complete len:118 (-) Transcript_98492:341-694(-)
MDETHRWHQRLSHVEIKEVMLARALIANYHVLCIHRPTAGFSDKASENVMSLLREFVTNKGVGQDMDPVKLEQRRPRTCIITSSKSVGVRAVDEVFHVGGNNINGWDMAKVNTEMLE